MPQIPYLHEDKCSVLCNLVSVCCMVNHEPQAREFASNAALICMYIVYLIRNETIMWKRNHHVFVKLSNLVIHTYHYLARSDMYVHVVNNQYISTTKLTH